MNKVISAEIKKILSKPGIYILAVLLALMLVLGVFIYKPTTSNKNFELLNANDVLGKYSSFDNNLKPNIQKEIDATINNVQYYEIQVNADTISHKENVSNLLEEFQKNLRNYLNCANDTSIGVETYIVTIARPQLVTSLQNLNTAIDTAINKAKSGAYAIVTTEKNYELYSTIYPEIYDLLKTEKSQSEINDVINEYKEKYENKFIGCIKSLKYPTISKSTIKSYTTTGENTKLSILHERLNQIEQEIIVFKDSLESDQYLTPANCTKIENMATCYKATADTYINMVKYELISGAFNAVSTKDQLNLQFLKEESEFNSESLAIRYKYLFENNKTENDYALPLTIGKTSNTEKNAYDYAYFILRIFSFVIIIYAVMSACQTIAGEVKEGSMRYFAIRPISRKNIYFGKMLSILLMSIIMVIFSAVVALCVGGAVYGFNSLNILTIFDGSFAMVVHPAFMLGIYLFSFIVELLVYLSIAMFLSCFLKSDLFGVTLIMFLYIFNTILPLFVSGPNTWLAYYPFSHISLYALFGSSVYAVSGDFFNLIFGMKIYAGTSIWLTLIISFVLMVIFNIIASKRFNKKEL